MVSVLLHCATVFQGLHFCVVVCSLLSKRGCTKSKCETVIGEKIHTRGGEVSSLKLTIHKKHIEKKP